MPVAVPIRTSSPTPPPRTIARASRRRKSRRRLRGVFSGAGWWEVAWPLVLGSVKGAGSGELTGLFVVGFSVIGGVVGWGAVAGCDIIDPHSSGINRHQAEVSVQAH